MNSSRFSLPSSACLFTSLIVGVCALGCVTEDADPVAPGTAGSGGSGAGGAPTGAAGTSPGTAGTNPGAGGSGGSTAAGDVRSDPAFGVALECAPVQQALITDFSAPGAIADAGADAAAPVTTGVTFGDFTTTFSGGTFTYPNAVGDPYAVNSDFSTGAWHLSGNVGNYSGFGLYFTGCNRIDASEYSGISFTVRGSVAMGNTLTFSVGTSSNDISFLWLNAQPTPPNPPAPANSGRCIPAMNQYDGTCATPSFTVPVTETETTIEVRWADLAAGRPSVSVDPAQITDIRWILPTPAGAGTTSPTTYAVDLFIDDLTFISP